MTSYRDALMEGLIGSAPPEEGIGGPTGEAQKREMRAEAATQRALAEDAIRQESDSMQPTVSIPGQMKEMQEIRGAPLLLEMRRSSSPQNGEPQNQIAPASMATTQNPPEHTDPSPQQAPLDPSTQQSLQKPPIPNRKSNILHRTFERGDPEHTIHRLQHTLRELESENRHLRSERGYIHQVYASAKEETSAIRRDFQDHIEKARFSRQKLEEKCDLIQKDNESLREYITSMSKAQEPIRGEEFYVQLFEELRGHIQSWMAKNSKLNAKETLEETVPSEVSGFLEKCGAHGVFTAQRFGGEIRELWTDRKTRVPLLRHVVALFLFETVFDRFAFGHDRAASEYLKWIEGDLFRQDIELTKILTIRQALGRAALQSQLNRPETLTRQETYKLNLTHILSRLLPRSKPEDIEAAVSKWVDKAVTLRNAMTEEQAIYRCFIPDTGDQFEDQVMEGAEENPTGQVLLCAFPGLDRLILKDGEKVSVAVVKASVELQQEAVQSSTPTEIQGSAE